MVLLNNSNRQSVEKGNETWNVIYRALKNFIAYNEDQLPFDLLFHLANF